MELIHQKDYFTIAKDVKKSKMCPYITRFLTYKDESDKELGRRIHNQNVLVISMTSQQVVLLLMRYYVH